MTTPGRNEPCPCGSGKKAKRCCFSGASPTLPQLDAHRSSNLDLRGHCMDAVIGSMDRWSRASKAFTRGFGAERDRLPFTSDSPPGGPVGIPWLLYHARPGGQTLLERYLAESRAIDLSLRSWMQAEREAWFSLWEIEGLKPGDSLGLVDLLSGRRRTVLDMSCSSVASIRGGLLARVVEHDGGAWFSGLHPTALPPDALQRVATLSRRALEIRGRCKPEFLQDPDASLILIEIWEEECHAQRKRPLPQLANSEGNVILFTTDRFLFDKADRPRIRKALLALEHCTLEPREPGQAKGLDHFILLSAEPDPIRPGHTILGSFDLSADELVLETNSVARADLHRARIEKATAGLLRHRSRLHEDPMAKLSAEKLQAGLRPPDNAVDDPSERLPPPPEILAMVKNMKAEHYRSWPDHGLPALSGKTAREAVKTPAGRRKVEALLRQIEHSESQLQDWERYDVGQLRKDLGLED